MNRRNFIQGLATIFVASAINIRLALPTTFCAPKFKLITEEELEEKWFTMTRQMVIKTYNKEFGTNHPIK